MLGALPLMSPVAGFADRVMARVTVPDPRPSTFASLRRRLFATRRSHGAGRVAAGAPGRLDGRQHRLDAWAIRTPSPRSAAGSRRRRGQAAWLGVRGVASNFIEQPWYAGLKALAAHPGRLALASALALAAYLGGVLALRRLLALPTQQVAHASA